MFTTTVTEFNGSDIAMQINDAVEMGGDLKVNGYVPVKGWGNQAATVWGNGTVSIKVKAKAKGKFNDIFFKVGSTVNIDHPAGEAQDEHEAAYAEANRFTY